MASPIVSHNTVTVNFNETSGQLQVLSRWDQIGQMTDEGMKVLHYALYVLATIASLFIYLAVDLLSKAFAEKIITPVAAYFKDNYVQAGHVDQRMSQFVKTLESQLEKAHEKCHSNDQVIRNLHAELQKLAATRGLLEAQLAERNQAAIGVADELGDLNEARKEVATLKEQLTVANENYEHLNQIVTLKSKEVKACQDKIGKLSAQSAELLRRNYELEDAVKAAEAKNYELASAVAAKQQVQVHGEVPPLGLDALGDVLGGDNQDGVPPVGGRTPDTEEDDGSSSDDEDMDAVD